MPFDFITSEPNASPTQGQDEAATPTRFDQSSLLDIAKANVGEDSAELSDWLAKQAYNNAERDIANGGDPRQYQTLDPRVAPEQLRKEYPSVAGINEALPRSIVQDMQRAQQRKEAMASADAGYQKTWANLPLRFGAGAITSMLDPVDDAAFMVPVVGEARYGAWLAKAGTAGGVAGRLAVTAGVGGLRGAVGGAILDVAKDGMNGGDVSLGDIATDALQNAVAGSLMHTAHGFHSDVMGTRFAETPEGQAAAGNADLHDNATRVAAAQMADDRPVDVRPVFDMARPQMSRADLMGSTAIDRVMPSYFDDAIQRAAGRPTQEAMIAEDVSQQAKATAPEQVLDGRAAEAERAINDLRTTGKLTPEEEAELAQYEPEQKVTASNEPKAATEAVKEGELFNNEPEHANLAGAMASPDEQVAGGLPHVMGGPDFRLAHTDTAITSSGREVPVQYAVVDAGHLTASHDADGNVNPQYPAELQPRDRARGTSSAQISKIAATLDPRLLMETPKASDGAPIVSPEGVVESGNGRTLAIRRAYSEHPEVAAKYRDALAARGYDVSGMGSPMLVRVRTGDMAENDIEAFTREANARDTLAYSATEQAQADARALPDHSLDLYRGGDIDAASNREFVKAFMTHAVPSAEHGSMVSADGALSQQAIQRIRAALLAKAYGDTDLISSIVESTDSNTKAIGGALTDVAGAWAKMRQGVRDGHVDPDMDITPHILDAVRLVERARKDGESIKGLVNQRDMFTGEAVDPLTEAVLRLMFNRDDFTSPVGRARLAQALSKYTDEATKASPGPDLLGLSTKAKPSDILSVAKGRTPDEHAQQDLLRPAIGAGESTGHPDGDGERRAGEIVPADGSDETARDERADGSLTPEAPKDATPNGVRLYSRQDEGGQRFEAARSDITNRLKQVGLQGKVALDVVDSLGGPAGMYHQNMITIAMDGPSAMGALDHEIIHAVRDAFHPAEWSALSRAAMADGNLMASVERRYPDLDRNGQIEEAVADMFSRFAREDRQPKGLIAAAFNRIKNLFQSIGNALRGQGFTTADDVMRAVSGGEIGARVGEPRDIAEPLGGAVYHDDGDVAKYSRSDADAANDQAEPFSAAKMDAATLAKQKLTAMQDITKRHAMFDKIQQIKEGGLTLAHGFDALTRGISEAVPGARDSTAQHQLANQEFLMSRLVSNLDKVPGAMEAWRSRALTAEWVRELSELNKKNGQPGISKSPLALEIAKAVHDAQDIARLNLNRAGAWVGDYEGYVSRTQHDAIKIHNAGFENWQHDVLAGVDQAKTFEDMGADEREDFLRNMWDALSTGVHMSSDHGADPKAAAFPGPGNMAKKASAGRVLHWTDADAWRNYQEKYGDPVIERGVMESLHRAGRDTALIERWGSNPKMAFENLIQQTRQTYRSDHDAIAKLDKALPRLREEFAHLTGEASRPQSALASQIRGSILALQDITKLGNVLLAHLSTTLTKPFQLQYLGVGRWKAYTSVLSNLIKDNTPEGHEILENLRANATGQFQEMIGGYEPVDGVPGQLARLRQFSMRIGGLPWMLGRQKAGTMWEVANFLGQSIGKSFSQLDERTARGLSIYGVTPAEWDALRMAPNHDADAAGSVYLTPAAAMRANVNALASDRLARAVDPVDADRIRTETRDRLAMKLAAYYGDAAERSTVTPGIQERAFFSRHAGRTWGPMVGQYKGWAMAAVRTMWGQSIHGSNSKAEAVKYLAELGAVGMAVGYARLAITSAANGMTPATFTGEPKHDVSLMSQAMLAGGALGIWGDYLMGQYAKQGESAGDRAKDLALNLLGPAFSDMATTYGLAHEYGAVPFADDSDEAWHKADADGAHFLTSHLPVVNTFYLRLLSRWLFIDRLNEMADPGYLQRHQDAVKEHAGQDFWLPPTQYAGAAA